MKHSGFSLVELSIVLVILGLLTGGVLTGQNLIRAAELRSVTTEFNNYQTAVMTFRDKYFALPGDMTNATDFWGEMTNCGVASPSGTGTQTCNGDGDGVLGEGSGVSRTGEMFGIWQHLANAGLIEGAYTGISGPGTGYHVVLGQNSPLSKLPNAGWSALERVHQAGHFAISYGHVLQFGGETTGTGTNYTRVLSPEEAWNIDKKMDDGKPARGSVVHLVSTDDCTNATGDTDFDADYELSQSGLLCSLIFVRAF